MKPAEKQLIKAFHEAKHCLFMCFATECRKLQDEPVTFGDDPCQGIRDALETQNAATALLQAAVADSQMLETQLASDLADRAVRQIRNALDSFVRADASRL